MRKSLPSTMSRTTTISTNSAADKADPAKNAQNFQTSPWSVSVEGEIAKPRTFTMDEILKLAPLEERIYRHRCVEAWSIVVPWIGFSFNTLIKLVEPTPKAKFVAFQSFYDPKQMPQSRGTGLDYPYVEGLRLDEAMNPLTLLCVGMYGETLPNQDGAPVRMVIPWKYGFKGIKSIVKIKFVKGEPPTTWSRKAPRVRLLFQRESHCRPPALEPGQGTSPRRDFPPQHADVQRLWRSGRQLVCRYESEEGLLARERCVHSLLSNKWAKVVVFIICLAPLGALIYRAMHGGLGANPVEFIQHATGLWTLRFLIFTLTITPLRKLLKLPELIRFRRMLGLFAFFYVCLHFLTYIGPDQSFDLAAMWKDVRSVVHHRRFSGICSFDSARHYFNGRLDSPPWRQALANVASFHLRCGHLWRDSLLLAGEVRCA